MNTQKALIVDDEPDLCQLAEITLSRMGLETRSAHNLADARELLASEAFDLCLTDMNLPDGNGIELVRHIQANCDQIPVAVITAYGNVEAAVSALKAGAFDFVSKPVDLQTLRSLVNAALSLPQTSTVSSSSTSDDDQSLLGDSLIMQELRRKIEKLARSQAPIFIHGESGSGKELVARLIHTRGARESRPFIPVNCGAIPAELMESEFFGHIRGSFTGATSDKDGLFKAADGGTLFLDEVADLPLQMQVKLLRAIQERSIRPVGGHQEVPVDIRLLSASHKNLKQLVSQGRFREDLYYRINVIELEVPPLRERQQDIPTLADFFLRRLNQASDVSCRLGEQAIDALKHYAFPGNVRELENILERALALADNELIDVDDLNLPQPIDSIGKDDNPATTHRKPSQANGHNLADQEKQAILRALEETRWNKTAAAKQLGLTLRQLRYRLSKLDIE